MYDGQDDGVEGLTMNSVDCRDSRCKDEVRVGQSRLRREKEKTFVHAGFFTMILKQANRANRLQLPRDDPGAWAGQRLSFAGVILQRLLSSI